MTTLKKKSLRRARVYVDSATDGIKMEDRIEQYLPRNYTIAGMGYDPNPEDHREFFVDIIGNDNAGWTLDGYVIPRLASGLIIAEEIDV